MYYYDKTSTELAKKYKCSRGYICKIWYDAKLKGKERYTYNFNKDYFKIINTEDKAYFLGFIAADGNIYNREQNQKILSLNIHKKDIEILEQFIVYMDSDFIIRHYNNMINIQIVSDKLCNDLSKYNIVERKTWIYEPVLLQNELMPHFLRGFLDGDGSIAKNHKLNIPSSYKICFCGNYKCMQFISNYLKNININNSFYRTSPNKYKHPFYNIEIHGATSKYCFLKYIYNNATVYLKRKHNIADKIIYMVENNTTNRSENIKAVEFYHNNF